MPETLAARGVVAGRQHMRAEARLAVDEVADSDGNAPSTRSAKARRAGVPEPKKPVKGASVTGIERRSVIERETPANRPRVASVTRNDGSLT